LKNYYFPIIFLNISVLTIAAISSQVIR